MDSELQHIADKVRSGRRIAAAEAFALWRGAPLWLLGELADGRKRAVSGDKVYYNRNFHIEPTNAASSTAGSAPTAVRRGIPRRGTTRWRRSRPSPAPMRGRG